MRSLGVLVPVIVAAAAVASAQAPVTSKPFEPTVGMPGKDVVWVPTPQRGGCCGKCVTMCT